MTVFYRWHPLHGQVLLVLRRQKQDRGDLLFCELASGQIVGIPAWMTDPSCVDHSLGTPQVSLEALLALRKLLTATNAKSGDPHRLSDNRPIQEVGRDTTHTASGMAEKAGAS